MTAGLRERLEAKARRRIVVPIQVSDPGDDARRRAEQAITTRNIAAAAGIEAEKLAALDAAVDDAEAALAEHTVRVELVAMPATDWEALTSTLINPDPDGPVDWSSALPLALEQCCEDETLKDAEWWAARIADPSWTSGDIASLRRAIIALHDWAPAAYVPKG